MKLIVMTLPNFFVEEHQILSALFDEGLETLHLRKPQSEPVLSERLLTLLPEYCRRRIVVHDHFYLKEEYGLRGIHLNSRNPEPPQNYRGPVSRSCHTAEEIVAHRKECSYLFLSPVFNSISKPDYPSPFSDADLRALAREKIIGKHVMALGGIDEENIARAKDLGFGGVVVLGDLWNKFDIHYGNDYKGLISHFRRLRRAAD